MTATAAKTGFGIKFGRETATPDTYADIAEIKDVTPPGASREVVDATHHGSEEGWREVIAALKSQKDCTLVFNYVPGGSAHADLMTDLADDDAHKYKITFPGGTESVIFTAFVTNVSPATPMDDVMTCSASFKPTGKPTWS